MMMNTRPLLLLIDGSSYFYRAFHALPPLKNSQGQATGAIYGVINMIRRLMKDYQPTYLAVIFDSKERTFRDDLYEQYKSHRPSMPDDLSSQFAPLLELIQAMGLPIIIEHGIEADDVIATLAEQASSQGLRTLVSTGDKDIAQIVDDNTTLINTMSQTILDREGVIAKFGVPPEQIVDYLSLIGDKSDNIPGVPGVGPKTAAQWLKKYGSLENLLAHQTEISGKAGENLRAAQEILPLAQALTTLKCDVELNITFEDLKPNEPDISNLINCLKTLEFKSWLKEMENHLPKTAAQPVRYTTLLSEETLIHWVERLQKADKIVIDTETTDLNPMNASLVGISFALKPYEAAYLPLRHDYVGAPKQIPFEWALAQLKPILEDPNIQKIGQNLKYDYTIFKNAGITLAGITFDTMLESYLQNSTAGRHDMDTLAERHLNYQTVHFEDLAGKKGPKQLHFNEIDIEKAAFYACEDADITFRLHQKLWPELASNEKMAAFFQSVEMPLVKVLADMEIHGVLIDAAYLKRQGETIAERLEVLEKEAFALAGQSFNLQSPKQLQEILFEKMQIPILQKTPTGQASTSEEVLQELAFSYPLPKVILEHRSLSKLKSTYIDALPQCINPRTNHVHTSFNQAVTSTGRLSSSQPNLQNIPIRTEDGRKIRQAFIAPKGYTQNLWNGEDCLEERTDSDEGKYEGRTPVSEKQSSLFQRSRVYKLLSADYSQIELRLMAHLSQDPGLINAFKLGLDIHRATAAEIHGVPLESVTHEQRQHAKAVNFGLIYGMSAFGLARQLGIPREAAQYYIDVYFKRYPKVQEFMESTRRYAHEKGYVETLMGRVLPVPDIHSHNIQRKRGAERAAINAPLQGSAADIIKKAMVQIHDWIQHSHLDLAMILQVHDELVFEVKEEHVEKAKEQIQYLMENAIQLSVKLEVSVGIGNNWDEAH